MKASSTITGNFWAFGDGNVSSTSSAQHTFSSPGLYNTELIVVDQNGCFDTIIQNISVFNNPNALFTFNDTCIGFANHLNSISSSPNGNIMTHQWSFGDGQSSSIDSTQHIYSSSGSYDVKLTVLDQLGCYDTMMHTIRVHEKPHTDFNFNNACFGEPVIFTNASLIGSPYSLNTFEWTLGNGVDTSKENFDYLYDGYGTYDIQLIVNSNENCADTLIKQLIIHPLPNTEFSAVPIMACEPAIINFTDLTSINSNHIITEWAWTFGDGGTSSLSNPSHLYEHTGSGLIREYDVSLTAKNIFGCIKDTLIEKYITILKKPTAGFNADLLQKLPNFKIKVNNSSSTDVVKWEYDFGFGNTDTIPSPYYIFQDSGLYKIYQIVQNSVGCKDTSDFYILLKPDPVVYIPTAFSPNSDGINDIIYVRGIEIDEIRFSIFNRWGKMLFRTDDINNGWDGTYMGDRLQPAVFIYTLDVVFHNGEKEYMKGNVTLVR
ncbi:MAG TPA: PKD domain-containing protein [Bacteroidetes bacterium]|nr:PKD domain-containing protein [Bacteroidota bacterium]